MTRYTLMLAVLVPAVPLALVAQDPHQPMHHSQDHMQRMQHLQDMHHQMEGLMTQLHQLNQQMQQQQLHCADCSGMVRNMEQAGERLQDMLRQMERVEQTPDVMNDPARVRDMDQLQERLRNMIGEMERAEEALRNFARP